jgi:signal transduction histidine kinase
MAKGATAETLMLAGEAAVAIDRMKAARDRERRRARLNSYVYPVTRLLGCTMLLVVIVIHNWTTLPDPNWPLVARYGVVLELYCLASWAFLWYWYDRVRVFDVGLVFMWFDVAMWTAGIYASGATHSWIFFFSLLRVSDQSFLSFPRAVWFAHVAPLSYLLMLAYVAGVDHRAIPWPSELAKVFLLYMCAVYLLVIGWNAKLLRDRTMAAVELARNSIGELREKSVQLEEARQQAEAANVAKSSFLANMSHELRTPLHAIIGYSEMLIEEATDSGASDFLTDLERIRTSGRHLLGLINDVLDVSKIEAGRMDVNIEEFQVDDLLSDVMATAEPLARRGQNKLELETSGALGSMYGDVTRTRQIMLNLLSNAAKFTDHGVITVTALRRDVFGVPTLIIRVCDTGIGMSPEQLSKLFRPFTQVDQSPTRRYEGTGLGLLITKRFAQLLGGSLSVESEPGVGTCFELGLPLGTTMTSSRTTGAIRVMNTVSSHSADLALPHPTPASGEEH